MTEKQMKTPTINDAYGALEEYLGNSDINDDIEEMIPGNSVEVRKVVGEALDQVLALLKSMQKSKSVGEIVPKQFDVDKDEEEEEVPSNRRKIGQAIVLFGNEGEVLEVVKLREGETAEDAFAKIAKNEEYFREDGGFEENIITEIID